MRRIVASICLVLGATALLVFGTGADGSGSSYEVRAIFDNGGFLVPGEEIRIAGARVGQVASVDVTSVDEEVHADGSPDPGKAVVVMRIDDSGFQDFRADATCLIRPQSLLGEKFVECKPTEPRAPGSEPPPPLKTVPDGQPGAGQHFLPLEQNGKEVDLDIVNDIMKEPYPDRFRLILNELGAGLAARGEDLNAIIRRADPALRETDQVLSILAQQNHQLAQLASDSDTILAPLAREREHIKGFINNAAVTASATAERGADLEAGLQKLPATLVELRATMAQLDDFSTTGTPVITDLGAAAPDLTRITKALAPFSRGGTKAFTSLGKAADKAGPDLVASEPVLGDVEKLAKSSKPVAVTLHKLLSSLRDTGGYKYLGKLIFNTVGSINGFDSYGHFLRALLPLNNCVNYATFPESTCGANFSTASKASKSVATPEGLKAAQRAAAGLDPWPNGRGNASKDGKAHHSDRKGHASSSPPPTDEQPPVSGAGAVTATSPGSAPKMRDAKLLLNFFMGSGK